MPTDYAAAARRALSGALISASIPFGTACGQTSNGTPRDDGGMDTSTSGADAGQRPDAAIDARKMDAVVVADAACVPNEPGSACASAFTGCPSVQVCRYDGSGFECPCEQCDLELNSSDCAWTFQGDYLVYGFQSGVDSVVLIAPDGGRSTLPEVETQVSCGNSPGWYAEGTRVADYEYTTLTFRLCQASCNDHQGDGGVSFLLGRHGCPIF